MVTVEGVCCWWLVYSLTWPESDWLDSGWVGLHTWGAWAIIAPQDKPAINTHTRGGATVMTIYHQLGEYHQPVNSNKHLCTTSTRVLCRRSPRKATSVACGGATLPHWRPMWGSSDQDGTRKGCPKPNWSHQPRQRTATPAPAPPERQRRPAEEWGGSAATATGNHCS